MDEKCFSLRKKRKCGLLTCGECNGDYAGCPFYKPRWMAERDTRKRLYRISLLPAEKQEKISLKYYHGQMPWKGMKP